MPKRVKYSRQFPARIGERQLVCLGGIGLTRIGDLYWVADAAALRYIKRREWPTLPDFKSFRRLADAKKELDARGRGTMVDSLSPADACA